MKNENFRVHSRECLISSWILLQMKQRGANGRFPMTNIGVSPTHMLASTQMDQPHPALDKASPVPAMISDDWLQPRRVEIYRCHFWDPGLLLAAGVDHLRVVSEVPRNP